MEFFCEQDLADFEDDKSTHKSHVDILLSVDYYYKFFLGKIIKNREGS